RQREQEQQANLCSHPEVECIAAKDGSLIVPFLLKDTADHDAKGREQRHDENDGTGDTDDGQRTTSLLQAVQRIDQFLASIPGKKLTDVGANRLERILASEDVPEDGYREEDQRDHRDQHLEGDGLSVQEDGLVARLSIDPPQVVLQPLEHSSIASGLRHEQTMLLREKSDIQNG